jgi:hypothetical protein
VLHHEKTMPIEPSNNKKCVIVLEPSTYVIVICGGVMEFNLFESFSESYPFLFSQILIKGRSNSSNSKLSSEIKKKNPFCTSLTATSLETAPKSCGGEGTLREDR